MRKVVFALSTALVAALIAFHPYDLGAQSAAVVKAPALKFGDPLPANLYVELAKAINPAVVNISTSVIPRGYRRDPFWDQLEEFYGRPMGPRGGGGRQGRPQQLSLGTGFVIREDGLIVTNAHVVRMADVVSVQFEEGSKETFEAKVVGADERSDIALLKIQPGKRKLTVAALGSSADVKVGEWVAAFGNPFGHGHTVTKGIVSSIGRAIEEINRFPLIQTDAAINPGNSGGPLVNTQGLVIGVNSAIDARAQGIGFAIPIDEVKRILPELENRGRLRKGFIGVGPADVVSYADQEAVGAGVVSVEKGQPAAKAGVRYGDTIIEFNGKKIRSSVELIDAVAGTAPGSKVKMKVVRQEGSKEKTLELDLTVAERPENPRVASRSQENTAPKGQAAPHNFGFSVADLTGDMRESLGLPDDLKKPVITDVSEGSVAGFVGLREGDVILEVNRNEVSSAKDVVGKLKKGANTIKLARGNRIIIVSIN